MAATVQILSYHGAGPSSGAWPANGLFEQSDADNTGVSAAPVPIPGSGSNYSWAKFWKLNFVTSPTGSATALKVYGPNADVATGIKMYMGKNAVYSQPVTGDGTALRSGILDLNGNYTSGSPLVITSGTVISNPTTGTGTQDYTLLQAAVASTAALGTYTGYTITYTWLET